MSPAVAIKFGLSWNLPFTIFFELTSLFFWVFPFSGVYCYSEKLIKTTADILVKYGYHRVGYKYVAVDDCWLAMTRDKTGNIRPDPVRFPSGIKALADYVRRNIWPQQKRFHVRILLHVYYVVYLCSHMIQHKHILRTAKQRIVNNTIINTL